MTNTNSPPEGECIYCGSLSYDSSGGKLHTEHIIPEFLGAQLTLPESSCRGCERIINECIEQPLAKGRFAPVRYRLGLRSKRRQKGWPEKFPALLVVEGDIRPTAMNIRSLPQLVVWHHFKTPGLFRGDLRPLGFCSNKISVFKLIGDQKSEIVDHGAIGIQSASNDQQLFARFLAKICHSYAAATVGLSYFGVNKDGYASMLPEIILGKYLELPIEALVGGMEDDYAEDVVEHGDIYAGHRLEMFERSNGEWDALAVRVRLLPGLAGPSYCAVVGLRRRH